MLATVIPVSLHMLYTKMKNVVNATEPIQCGNKGSIVANVKVLCVCGGLVALTFVIAIKLNRITALDFSTSTAITQNTCYAQCFFNGIINLKQ